MHLTAEERRKAQRPQRLCFFCVLALQLNSTSSFGEARHKRTALLQQMVGLDLAQLISKGEALPEQFAALIVSPLRS